MQTRVSGHHFDVSDRVRAHVASSAQKLQRFFDRIVDVQATIRQEARRFHVDLVVSIPSQKLKATAEADKVYIAIDQAADRMERQLRKVHDKRRDHRPDASESAVKAED